MKRGKKVGNNWETYGYYNVLQNSRKFSEREINYTDPFSVA